jgi:hypothetical protein
MGYGLKSFRKAMSALAKHLVIKHLNKYPLTRQLLHFVLESAKGKERKKLNLRLKQDFSEEMAGNRRRS